MLWIGVSADRRSIHCLHLSRILPGRSHRHFRRAGQRLPAGIRHSRRRRHLPRRTGRGPQCHHNTGGVQRVADSHPRRALPRRLDASLGCPGVGRVGVVWIRAGPFPAVCVYSVFREPDFSLKRKRILRLALLLTEQATGLAAI